MKNKQKAEELNLDDIIEKIRIGILMYFEIHKELLSDPDFNCAYKMLRDVYIKKYLFGVGIDFLEKYYRMDVENILSKNPKEVIEKYKPEAYGLADTVKRNNIASRYVEIFERYKQQNPNE